MKMMHGLTLDEMTILASKVEHWERDCSDNSSVPTNFRGTIKINAIDTYIGVKKKKRGIILRENTYSISVWFGSYSELAGTHLGLYKGHWAEKAYNIVSAEYRHQKYLAEIKKQNTRDDLIIKIKEMSLPEEKKDD
jgi:hypothetical protein